jgi:hypothetical protein
VPGKVIAMWMPILVFFYMVFEHSVVNMFLFPSGLMLHAPFSIADYFIWNEIPTVLGGLFDLRHPNKKFIATASMPLIERDPLLFWKCLSAILFVALLIVLALLVMHYGKH